MAERRATPQDLLVDLVGRLVDFGPYRDEIAIQKAAFIGQVLLGLPFELEWSLHTYGPYSRDIPRELRRCQETGRIRIRPDRRASRFEPCSAPPRSRPSPSVAAKIDLLAKRLAPMSFKQLEVVAMAAWATRFSGEDSIAGRAAYVHKLKPHIGLDRAERGLRYLDAMVREAREQSDARGLNGASGQDAIRSEPPTPARSHVASVIVARAGLFQRRLYFRAPVELDIRRTLAEAEHLMREANAGGAGMAGIVAVIDAYLASCGCERVAP